MFGAREALLEIEKKKNNPPTLCDSRGFTGGAAVEEQKQPKDDVINIFSVASGHLYERFLR